MSQEEDESVNCSSMLLARFGLHHPLSSCASDRLFSTASLYERTSLLKRAAQSRDAVRAVRQKNMIMCPAGQEAKNDCSGSGKLHFSTEDGASTSLRI
jgi:hypothetical protein